MSFSFEPEQEKKEVEYLKWLKTRPICCACGKPIEEDELIDVEGDLHHRQCARECALEIWDDCLAKLFIKSTENYIDMG